MNLKATADEGLVEILASGRSNDASSELFRRYQKKIYLWCFNYTHDVEEALDHTQEIFIKIFDNIDRFAGRSKLSTWIYSVTRNHCLGELARKRDMWRRRSVPLEENVGEDRTLIEHLREVELKGDLDRILSQAAGKMKEEELQAFILHYREGLTVKEITEVLSCGNATGARTLIQNARRKFDRFLGKGRASDDGT